MISSVSIFDVSREAGVSPSTVSRVLRGSSSVSSNTRKRVLEIAKRIGYDRKPAGRPAKRTPVLTIAIIYTQYALVHNEINDLVQDWIRGIRKALELPLVHLNVVGAADRLENDPVLPRLLENDDLKGAVLIGSTPGDGYREALIKRGVRLVLMDDRSPYGLFSSVSADHYGGVQQIVRYLVEHGHRRIAHFFKKESRLWASQQNAVGMEHALQAYDATGVVCPRLDPHRDSDEAQSRAIKEILDQGATAVVAGDYQAARLVEICLRMGINVPGDLSVCGFDNRELPLPNGLTLTTVGCDRLYMGQMAGQLLMRLIHDERIRQMDIVIPCFLKCGTTTA